MNRFQLERGPGPVLTFLEILNGTETFASGSRVPVEVALESLDAGDRAVRELTLRVGRDFQWPSQEWTGGQWERYLAAESIQHWAITAAGRKAGILSLNLSGHPDVEIDSFGLVPECHGQGIGRASLSASLRLIWSLGANRAWLHTSSHDHPNALKNYLASGFRVVPPPDAATPIAVVS